MALIESAKDSTSAVVSTAEPSMESNYDEVYENKLLEQATAGDCDSFTELFNRYYTMIYHFTYRLCLNQADAQDLAQETFIKGARSLASFRGKSSFKNWLYQIAVNTSRDWFRSSGRKARVVKELGVQIASEEQERPANFDPVHRALASLGEELRQSIVLVYYEGMNHSEAARVLGCAETTISWRVFNAKRKLKQLLQQNQLEDCSHE